ncbi:MAG: hypothetical protein IPK22_00740 [Verrucomicrobiaceae bacterium]|nr:hypothetical protein [Verrucomicrobiaceae bacterium]
MTYDEFQQRYEDEAGKDRNRYDAFPVSELLSEVRAGRLGERYQIWYSIGARASLAEAGSVMLDVLESDFDYLNRYHCAAALIAIAKLDPKTYEPAHFSANNVRPLRERLEELRRLLNIPKSERGSLCRKDEGEGAAEAVVRAPSQAPILPPLQDVPRSKLLTVFAWGVTILSAMVLPISVISMMMMAVGSYGTSNADPLGALAVFFGPAIMFAAGIGLWRRWKWAWFVMVALMIATVSSNLFTIISVESKPKHFTSASGVETTIVTDGFQNRKGIIMLSGCVLAFLCTRRVRSEFFH